MPGAPRGEAAHAVRPASSPSSSGSACRPHRRGRQLRHHRRLRQAVRDLQAKFANAVNFRGFPHMPGNDFIAACPSSRAATTRGKKLMSMSITREPDRRAARELDRHALSPSGEPQGRGHGLHRPGARLWRDLYGSEPETLPAYSGDWAEATGSEAMLERRERHLIADPASIIQPGRRARVSPCAQTLRQARRHRLRARLA